jgi:hypothetical protein
MQYELGAMGAFGGLEIVAIQQPECSLDSNLDFSLPKAAMEVTLPTPFAPSTLPSTLLPRRA